MDSGNWLKSAVSLLAEMNTHEEKFFMSPPAVAVDAYSYHYNGSTLLKWLTPLGNGKLVMLLLIPLQAVLSIRKRT